MHFARLENSPRLQRVLNLLLNGPHTTRQIIQKAGFEKESVCAVNSAMCELRLNGIPVLPAKCLSRGEFLYSLPEGQLNLNFKSEEKNHEKRR